MLAKAERVRQRKIADNAYIPVQSFDHIRSWLRAHGKPHRGRTNVFNPMPAIAALAKKRPTSTFSIEVPNRRALRVECVVLEPEEVELLEMVDYDAHGFGKRRAFHPDRDDCRHCVTIGRALLDARRRPNEPITAIVPAPYRATGLQCATVLQYSKQGGSHKTFMTPAPRAKKTQAKKTAQAKAPSVTAVVQFTPDTNERVAWLANSKNDALRGWKGTEADLFARAVQKTGIPFDHILHTGAQMYAKMLLANATKTPDDVTPGKTRGITGVNDRRFSKAFAEMQKNGDVISPSTLAKAAGRPGSFRSAERWLDVHGHTTVEAAR